jgi:hypothetical protein
MLGVVTSGSVGCTHRARVHRAPEAGPLVARQEQAGREVQAATVKFAAATAGLRAARESHARAVQSHTVAAQAVTALGPAVDSLRLRVPVELRGEVDAALARVQTLSDEIEKTTSEMTATTRLLTSTQADQAAGTAALERGNAGIAEINERLAPAYFSAVEDLAKSANAESARAARAENRADHRGRILGLACALAAALAATRLVRLAAPATWAWPATAFALAYAVGRWAL